MRVFYPYVVLFSALSILASCKKDANSTKTASTTGLTSSTSIAITSLDAASSSGSTDSLYLVNCNPPRSKRDTIAFSALPASISTYLTANYSGYSFFKAFVIADSLKATTGYVVVIKYNNAFVGLKFAADGIFVKVLEQMTGQDMKDPKGKGFHPGGPFGDRDGKHRDTIAVSAIPSAVLTYFTTNYPSDTLLHASITPDTSYVLISKNKVLYATDITAAGAFVKRVQLEPKPGPHKAVAEADLPASVATYLTATYPGYVFNKAFLEAGPGNTVRVYHVFITVNSTNYAVDFDASGAFVKAVVIH